MNAFDVVIIGFGKGGKTLAAEFAKRGQTEVRVSISAVSRLRHWYIRRR